MYLAMLSVDENLQVRRLSQIVRAFLFHRGSPVQNKYTLISDSVTNTHCDGESVVSIFSPFDAGIADAISSSNFFLKNTTLQIELFDK